MAAIYELCCLTEHGIYAIPFRGRHARPALKMTDGAIVEAPLPDQVCEPPDRVADSFAIAQGGVPATIHHANLGLVVAFLPLSGVYLLPDGDVAAIYGAEAVPIGVRAASEG